MIGKEMERDRDAGLASAFTVPPVRLNFHQATQNCRVSLAGWLSTPAKQAPDGSIFERLSMDAGQ